MIAGDYIRVGNLCDHIVRHLRAHIQFSIGIPVLLFEECLTVCKTCKNRVNFLVVDEYTCTMLKYEEING